MELLCTRTFKMEAGEVCFTIGQLYTFEYSSRGMYTGIDDECTPHLMQVEYLINYFVCAEEDYND